MNINSNKMQEAQRWIRNLESIGFTSEINFEKDGSWLAVIRKEDENVFGDCETFFITIFTNKFSNRDCMILHWSTNNFYSSDFKKMTRIEFVRQIGIAERRHERQAQKVGA